MSGKREADALKISLGGSGQKRRVEGYLWTFFSVCSLWHCALSLSFSCVWRKHCGVDDKQRYALLLLGGCWLRTTPPFSLSCQSENNQQSNEKHVGSVGRDEDPSGHKACASSKSPGSFSVLYTGGSTSVRATASHVRNCNYHINYWFACAAPCFLSRHLPDASLSCYLIETAAEVGEIKTFLCLMSTFNLVNPHPTVFSEGQWNNWLKDKFAVWT